MFSLKIKNTWKRGLLTLLLCCAVSAVLLAGCAGVSSVEESSESAEVTAGASSESAEATAEAGPESAEATAGAEPESAEVTARASSEPAEVTAEAKPESAEVTAVDAGEPPASDILRVRVLKVGKADAIVLICGEQTMVIDCGEDEDGQKVLDYLEKEGIGKIDVLEITHFDKDHVGGADTVLEGIPVERVLVSAYEGSGTQYEEFLEALEKTGITPEKLTETETFPFSSASVTVEPPASYEIPDDGSEYDNNFSLITTVELGSNRLVFTGDIEKKRIRDWMAGGTVQQCDVVKIPHHGSYNKALKEMIAAMQPSYALITDSEKNPAEDKTLEMLEEYGVTCYRTMNGNISVVCDGQNITVEQ